jgi:hypothetical protein
MPVFLKLPPYALVGGDFLREHLPMQYLNGQLAARVIPSDKKTDSFSGKHSQIGLIDLIDCHFGTWVNQ